LIALALDFFRRNFHTQGGDTFGLLLDNNIHGKWDRRGRRGG
jgi:hypothetical protein